MDNPFAKRATEHVRDEEAFLSIVSHLPLSTYLTQPGAQGLLYDRLVTVLGSPGSGKSTLARLFEYGTLAALVRHGATFHRELFAALGQAGALDGASPRVAGCRLPMESEYREIWEFPYGDELKGGLTRTLIQSRAVLAWLRGFERAGVPLGSVSVVPQAQAAASLDAIGGMTATGLQTRAREVERAVYEISASLVAPPVDALHGLTDAVRPYRPFDVIERFDIAGESTLSVQPLVVLDDAHSLHPRQLEWVQSWLRQRELRVARWILMRLDLLTPAEAFLSEDGDAPQGSVDAVNPAATRDVLPIFLQAGLTTRVERRKSFNSMARDMANRYLRRMPLFTDRGFTTFAALLDTTDEAPPAGRLSSLRDQIDKAQRRLSLSATQRGQLERAVESYVEGSGDTPEDVALAMLLILLHRFAGRLPQQDLFPMEKETAVPTREVKADSSVAEGARIHLLHQFDRPFYFGFDTLSHAGSENAEQFLLLASRMVDLAATRVVRSKPAALPSRLQDRELRKHAREVIGGWTFPRHDQVRDLLNEMGSRCQRMSIEPNAPLGAGANAFGIPRHEFERISKEMPALAHVLHSALAHNTLLLVPKYACKGQEWSLLELGGLAILDHGLTFKRGGFIESTAGELADIIGGVGQQ